MHTSEMTFWPGAPTTAGQGVSECCKWSLGLLFCENQAVIAVASSLNPKP